MKKPVPIAALFFMAGGGAFLTLLALCLILYSVTDSVFPVLVCILTAAVLTVWAVLLVHILQRRLSLFADDVCSAIDEIPCF